MKITTLILFLPFLLGAQKTADVLQSDSAYPNNLSFNHIGWKTEIEKPFTDTIQVYAMYVTDTLTDESKTARMLNERKGNIWAYVNDYGGIEPRKIVKQSKFWLPNGRVVDKNLVLVSWSVRKNED